MSVHPIRPPLDYEEPTRFVRPIPTRHMEAVVDRAMPSARAATPSGLSQSSLASCSHRIAIAALVAVEFCASTKSGVSAKKPWVTTYKGRIVTRHRWRENAEYRAKQMREALENGFIPASDFAERAQQIELVSTELTDRFEKGFGRLSGSREPSPSSTGLGPSGFDPGRDPEQNEADSWALLFFVGLCGFVGGFTVACVTLILLARVITGAWL